MSTVSTSLRMFDMMTKPLQQVTQALNLTINAMEQMNNAGSRDLRVTNSLNSARDIIRRAGTDLQDLVNEQDRVRNSQNRLNDSFNRGSNSTVGLISKVRGLIAVYAGMRAIQQGINATDTYVNQNARLSLINDKLQTQEQLQNKIFQAAQRSRGSYNEMVNSVAKLGLLAKDAFKSNNETIAFAELMNKAFKVSNASIAESSSAMYQLTQAMAAGRLQGDEFRAVMENAPMLAEAIAKYTGKSMGELKQMSADGVITSNIIKNALFSAADDINAKFKTMPATFGSVWTSIKNKAVMEFSRIMQKVNNFLNSDVGASAINNITNSIAMLTSSVGWLIDSIIFISTLFNNNWGIIQPLIWGIIGALIVYNAVMGVAWLTTLKTTAGKVAHAIASWAETAAIIALTLAQDGLNAALALCPISWIIISIIVLVTILYVAVGAVNKFAGTSVSATGMITGAFMTALAFIGNLFISAFNLIVDVFASIWNFIASFAEFFANVFNDPIGSIVRLFAGMADTVLGILEGIASAVDTLFGSNLASSVNGWRSGLKGAADNLVGEAKIKVERADPKSMHLNRFDYGKAYDTGYNFGKGIEEKIKIPSLDNLMKNAQGTDLGKSMNSASFSGLDDESKKHLKNLDDKIDISNEHLEMLRDLAEAESIQNFVTLTPTVQVTTGDIREEADINRIIAQIETYMENELVNSAEGVYASV